MKNWAIFFSLIIILLSPRCTEEEIPFYDCVDVTQDVFPFTKDLVTLDSISHRVVGYNFTDSPIFNSLEIPAEAEMIFYRDQTFELSLTIECKLGDNIPICDNMYNPNDPIVFDFSGTYEFFQEIEVMDVESCFAGCKIVHRKESLLGEFTLYIEESNFDWYVSKSLTDDYALGCTLSNIDQSLILISFIHFDIPLENGDYLEFEFGFGF